jgi:hypothetical protein
VTNLGERVASETVLPPVINQWYGNATLMDFAIEKSLFSFFRTLMQTSPRHRARIEALRLRRRGDATGMWRAP